jgi:hypothetical protein
MGPLVPGYSEGAQAEVPYESAEALLVPGSPGSVFVALRPVGSCNSCRSKCVS